MWLTMNRNEMGLGIIIALPTILKSTNLNILALGNYIVATLGLRGQILSTNVEQNSKMFGCTMIWGVFEQIQT